MAIWLNPTLLSTWFMDVPYGVYICKLIFLRRTCDDWKCLGRCDMYLTLETEFQDYTTTDDIDLVIIKKLLFLFILQGATIALTPLY